jgi:putative flippase GtrA
MNELVRQAAAYGAASLFALIVDVSLLWILVAFLQLPYLVAATLSFLAGAGVAYCLSVRFAFKEHRLSNRRAEVVSFIAIGTVGLGVNAAVIDMAVKYLGLHYLLAKCVAAGCTFTCNFIGRRQFLFVQPRLPAGD